MKSLFRHIITFVTLLPMVLCAGCVMENFEDDLRLEPDNLATVGYMAVRLMPSDGADSRAVGDEFNVGTLAEFQLSTQAGQYAVFYTEGQDTPIGIAELNGMQMDQGVDGTANSSVVYAAIAGRNELREMLEILQECYVILNTYLTRDDLLHMTKEDLLNLRVDSPFFIDSQGNRFFTMCNSVYVENGAKKIFTHVDTDKIYQSYQETIEQAWKGNAAVNAYVERLAAKFAVSFENEDFNEYGADRVFVTPNNTMTLFSHVTDGDVPFFEDHYPGSGIPYTYKIRITGWGVNAIEKESLLYRNFRPAANYFTGWYNTTYKRVFWSEDCNYGNATYPWQYRRVIDNSGIPVYEGSNNILENFSYEEMNLNQFTTKYLYSPENTYDYTDKNLSASLNNRPELLAGTHIIVCAELLTNIENPNEWHPHEIYRDRNGTFYANEVDCAKALLASMNNSLKSHSYLKFTYWDWTKGGVEMKLFGSTKGEFAIYYNDRKLDAQYIEELYNRGVRLTSEAEFKGSDGKRILWADGMSIQDQYGNLMQTYSNIDEVNSANNKWMRESSVNDIKSVIFEHVGAVDHFNEGKMYYAVPIGYVKDAGSSADNTYSVYGVVRNSSYDIVIKGVSGIGASVDDVSQPIVPNTVTTSDHLFIGFDILHWHPIEQTVPGAVK